MLPAPKPFHKMLAGQSLSLTRKPVSILQINLGKLCNQTCHHCHVEAGPSRKEIMTKKTLDRILDLLGSSEEIKTADLTGGAPELNPNFRYLVKALSEIKMEIIDRSNLTVFFEKGQDDTPNFLSQYGVRIIASLPCYSEENVDRQRGKGVFSKSIQAIQWLNRLGYGMKDSGLILDLVYNPQGPTLPPPQARLQKDYHRELENRFGIFFNQLLTITNMPIKRFRKQLDRNGQLATYMELLVKHFNVPSAEKIMCRDLLSIGWDGKCYDCDFNQMLEIPAASGGKDIWEINSFSDLSSGEIAFGNHCYGCTAGAGSSCGGALVY